MMDPPWRLASAQPTRGVALGYQQLADTSISDLPVGSLATNVRRVGGKGVGGALGVAVRQRLSARDRAFSFCG